MSRNWLRSCQLSVGGTTVSGGGPTDLRIVFHVKQWHSQSPNMANFRIYNPSPDTRGALQSAAQGLAVGSGAKVEFSAGYQDNVGLVFSGDLKQTIAGHESAVDSYIDIFAADGDQGYNQARVTKTLNKGYTPQDKLQAAVDAMSQFGVTMGKSTLDLSQPQYPRGAPLMGMARDIIREVVLSAGGLWSIQNGQVMATDKTMQGASSGAITLDSTTGLIGWPRQTEDGIIVRSLLNPALQPLGQINLDPSSIIAAQKDNNPFGGSAPTTNYNLDEQALAAGTYTIFHMDRFGDTRGQDWYDESMCVGAGAKQLPPSAAAAGYYLPRS